MLDVEIVKLWDDSKIPTYAHETDAGLDVYAYFTYGEYSSERIEPLSSKSIPTGISINVPIGWECQIRSRSGLAFNDSISVLNSPATIDSHFTGEIKVLLYNHGRDSYIVHHGDRVAQLVFAPVTKVALREVKMHNINEATSRGTQGFGSSGK